MGNDQTFYADVRAHECVLALRGDLDLGAVEIYNAALDEILRTEPPIVIIDLGDVTFLASMGVSCLVQAQQRHPRVVLRRPRLNHLRLLELTGLDEVFEIGTPLVGD